MESTLMRLIPFMWTASSGFSSDLYDTVVAKIEHKVFENSLTTPIRARGKETDN